MEAYNELEHVFGTHRKRVKLLIKRAWITIKWVKLPNFGLSFLKHHSLCGRAMKALSMLCTYAGASEY